MFETYDSVEKSLTIRCNFASKDFLNKMKQHQEDQCFIDIVLYSDSEDSVEIPAHKAQ